MKLFIKSAYFFIVCALLLTIKPLNANELSVLPHGIFIPQHYMNPNDKCVYSDNGAYYGEFEIGVNDLNRRVVKQLRLYNNSQLLFTFLSIAGDDFTVSNSGYVVVYDLPYKEGGDLTIRIFDKNGTHILEKTFQGASLFGFSPSGNKYGIGSRGKFEVYNLSEMSVQTLPPTTQFAISNDDALLSIARDDGISIYSVNGLLGTIVEPMALNYVRKIQFTDDNKSVAFIGKHKLAVYNTENFSRRFVDEVSDYHSFADLKIIGSNVYAGIHVRNEETRMSHGIIRTYDISSRHLISERECTQASYMSDMSKCTYDYEKDRLEGNYTVPWPFEPQDKSKMVWNGYCQNVASGTGTSGAYMHQGTDLDVSTKDRCVAVESGITKCNLTLGGDLYWRIASCTVNVAERSNGWLYAHLVKSSITKQPGDKITKGEFLATIVPWTSAALVNGAHLHFAHISDKGTIWNVSDADEWDNEKNPLTYIRPTNDTKAPTFLNAFTNAKFAFTTNDNGSPQFIKTNELKGEVDVYAHISDVVGESPWEQPAHSLFYWIRCLENNTIVLQRKVGLIMNQRMKGYGGAGASNDYTNLVPVMYHCDKDFPAIGWSDKNRHHLQNVTNSNGDSLVTVGHKKNALNTALYGDGNYRIYIEAVDAALNSAVDSMDVSFKNGTTGLNQDMAINSAYEFAINRVTFNANKLQVAFNMPFSSNVNLYLYNTHGVLIAAFLSGKVEKGLYSRSFKGAVPSGMYLLKLEADIFTSAMRFVKVK